MKPLLRRTASAPLPDPTPIAEDGAPEALPRRGAATRGSVTPSTGLRPRESAPPFEGGTPMPRPAAPAMRSQARLEMDAYRLMRAVDGRPVGGAEMTRLGHAAAAVDIAREFLCDPTDPAGGKPPRTPSDPANTKVARAYMHHLLQEGETPEVARCAGAIAAHGGNTKEFAAVTAAMRASVPLAPSAVVFEICEGRPSHLPVLDVVDDPADGSPGTTAVAEEPHAFALEVDRDPTHGGAIVLDAWSLGPSVSAVDSRLRDFTVHLQNKVDRDAPEVNVWRIAAATSRLESSDAARATAQAILNTDATPSTAGPGWDRTETLHPQAAQRMHDKLTVTIGPGDAGEALRGKFEQRLDILQQAADVLRQYDDTASRATQDAPALVAAARGLTDDARRD